MRYYNNPFGNLGLDPLLNASLNNLRSTLDPRDQLYQDITMYQNGWSGNPGAWLRTRLSQLDPRDQEAQDIRSMLLRNGW